LKLIWLHVVAMYWKRRHEHARDFRSRLEGTIHSERLRAQHDVEETETLMRRAAIAIVAYRADRQIVEDARVQQSKTGAH
jgi:hypothetical protein